MIHLKTKEEVEIMRENALLVSATLEQLAEYIVPGVTTARLDKIAEEFIRDHGAIPGFLGYEGFPSTLCTSVNEGVVHGIPSAGQVLKDGDIVSVDCGTILKGFYGDSAYTFAVGNIHPEAQRLLDVTKEALYKGVAQAKAGNRVGDISAAVQKHAETAGYSVVRDLTGHGLGRKMHEDPEVPNFGIKGRGPILKEGMVICIEPMINAGSKKVFTKKDGWAVCTRDGRLSAHYEFAVAIRGVDEDGKPAAADVLTDFGVIERAIAKARD